MVNNQTHVVSNPNGGWDVKKDGAQRSSQHLKNKEDAIDRAKELCKKQKGELLIHNKNGKISRKHSYGNDPYPPEG